VPEGPTLSLIQRGALERALGLMLVSVAVLALAGCSTTKPGGAVDEGETLEEQLKRVESDFRPSELDPEAPVREDGTVQPGIESAADTAGAPGAGLEMDMGFRVQLYSTPSIDEAKARKEEAEALFPDEWFYMEYDAPTYKIRAGNFRTRFDADRFARLLVEKGFADSWSVPSKVFRNPGVRP
jgi:hypothetical protein